MNERLTEIENLRLFGVLQSRAREKGSKRTGTSKLSPRFLCTLKFTAGCFRFCVDLYWGFQICSYVDRLIDRLFFLEKLNIGRLFLSEFHDLLCECRVYVLSLVFLTRA